MGGMSWFLVPLSGRYFNVLGFSLSWRFTPKTPHELTLLMPVISLSCTSTGMAFDLRGGESLV
jgi:hypothetical protein